MWEFIKFTVQTLNAQLSERFTDHQRGINPPKIQSWREVDLFPDGALQVNKPKKGPAAPPESSAGKNNPDTLYVNVDKTKKKGKKEGKKKKQKGKLLLNLLIKI